MKQSPIVDAVAEELGDKVKVCKVNVDEQASLALDYQVVSIPTLVFMKQGMFQERMVGLQDKQTIVDYLNTLIDEK
jgi:thioredoxin 1